MNTASVALAVTPSVVSTLFSHYLRRKSLPEKPTAHLSYDEGLHLLRSFLAYASKHTVEELQAFTSQWVPHPHWIRVDEVEVPEEPLAGAASLLQEQLGPDGTCQVGGKLWWQWRKPNSPLKAEWIEMRADYNERKRNGDLGNRIMLYVHGGAYYFGSVDEHRYQMQRHARKLKARVFAPRYRLSPQFPFPCGLQDCLAAYLYLLTLYDPKTIVLAGDSAGAGMIVSMLVVLRDRGTPLPAGAVLISPWVDLTHSFPSVTEGSPLDYIPQSGFHHKPSEAWPPPTEQELEQLKKLAIRQKQRKEQTSTGPADSHATDAANSREDADSRDGIPSVEDVARKTHRLSFDIDGERVEITEQIQMYTTNDLLAHPLVSPVMQPSLGGLPPLMVMVGSGEILRDEQIFLAHKAANPEKYALPSALLSDEGREQVGKHKPTDVQLQVYDDLCHVAPVLSFTRPAKYAFRSVAQFSAWCLARAQEKDIDIPDDDEISVITGSDSESADAAGQTAPGDGDREETIGKAGDPLPPFKDHMIRQRITKNGHVLPLPPPEDLPGCVVGRESVGVFKVETVKKWLARRQETQARFQRAKVRVDKVRLRKLMEGFDIIGEGEVPPPSALAGRRKVKADLAEAKKTRSIVLSLWAHWGSGHDNRTVKREQEQSGQQPDVQVGSPSGGRAADPMAGQGVREEAGEEPTGKDHPSPRVAAATGVTGKRPRVDGIAMPFSLNKDAETASMITLDSGTRPASQATSPEGAARPRSSTAS